MFLINPSNPETLFYCPLNIQILARLPTQETYRSMLLNFDIGMLCTDNIPIISMGKRSRFCLLKLSNFGYSAATLKWLEGTKKNFFGFLLIVTFLFKHHTENFKTYGIYICTSLPNGSAISFMKSSFFG